MTDAAVPGPDTAIAGADAHLVDPDAYVGNDARASELSAEECSDGVDNDGDMTTDCEDVGCAAYPFCDCPETLPVAGRDIRWPLPSSITLAGGWNTLLTSPAGNCMEPAATVVLGGDPEARFEDTLQFQLVEEASSLRESLALEASASYESGIYSADASASYARSSHVSSYSTYLVLESTVRFAPRTLAAFRVQADDLSDLARSPSAFLRTCGDQFVSTVVPGAVFRVVFRFTGLSARERTEVAAAIGGSTGTFSGSAAAASSLEALRSRYETSITVFRSGAPPEPFSGDLASLIESGLTFVSSVTSATAVPIQVSTRSYYNADNFPVCSALPDYVDEFRNIEDLAHQYESTVVVINDIEQRVGLGGRLTEPACSPTLTALRDRQAALRAYQRELVAAFDDCSRAAPSCTVPLPTVSISSPTIPTECGPTCATGEGASYAFDSLGYCTRCEWRVSSTSVSHNSVGFRNVCRFMRPSARALARLGASSTYVDGYSPPGIFSWMEIYVDVAGDGSKSCPVPGGDSSCRLAETRGFTYPITSIANRTRALAGEVNASIYAARCTTTGDRTCRFDGVVMQVCDESADESVGCSPL